MVASAGPARARRVAIATTAALLAATAAWSWLGGNEVTPLASPLPPVAAVPSTAERDAADAALEVAELARETVPTAPATLLPADAAVGDATTTDVTFLVLDCAGEPVAEASVELFAVEGGRPIASPPLLSLRTGPTGTCLVRMQRPIACARASHPDFGRSVAHIFGPSVETLDCVRLWLGHPTEVRGIVLDAEGQPVPNATLDVTALGMTVPQTRARVQRGPICTAAGGRFRFDANVGAPLQIVAVADAGRSDVVRVTVREGMEDVVVAFPGALMIAGLVADASGTPVDACTVRVRLPGRGSFEASTDGRGMFRVPVDAAGDYCVVAHDEERQSPCNRQVVSSTTPRPYVELRVAPKGPISGRVLHADGRPAPKMVVRAQPETAAHSGCLAAGIVDTESQADGAFHFLLPAWAAWQLTVKLRSVGEPPAPVRGVDAGQRDVRIVIPSRTERELYGEVRRARDGSPVVGYHAHFERRGDDGSVLEGRPAWMPSASPDNRFRTNVPPGTDWHLVITADDLETAPASLAVPAESASPMRATIKLQPWPKLTVRVVRDQRPVRGVRVQVVQTLDGAIDLDASGVARFGRVAPGKVVVSVFRFDEVLAERVLEVSPGSDTELVVQLQR